MNYAQHIKNTYLKNKDQITKIRKSQGLSYVLTLEDALKDGDKAYTKFCNEVGIKPKKIIDFLKTGII